MIFDTHAHYDDEAFDPDRDEVLKGLPTQGIEYIVNAASTLKSVEQLLKLTKQYSYIYGTVGIHPNDAGNLNEERFAWLQEKAKQPKVVAIGEIGLDYYYEEPEPEIQKIWFLRQLALAKELGLPVVIHSRDAAKDTYDMLKEANTGLKGAIIHCFSYSVEQARQYLDMGFYLGVGGVVTFTNARRLKEVVEFAPLERLVLETDCPYLAPVPNRGKRNTSANLTYVAQEIARIKNTDYDTVLRVTTENAKTFYGI